LGLQKEIQNTKQPQFRICPKPINPDKAKK
jgi:hypothetical protein